MKLINILTVLLAASSPVFGRRQLRGKEATSPEDVPQKISPEDLVVLKKKLHAVKPPKDRSLLHAIQPYVDNSSVIGKFPEQMHGEVKAKLEEGDAAEIEAMFKKMKTHM